MKIAHFAPWAPYRCGLYEAARDMLVADRQAGHAAIFVDVGITEGGVRKEGLIGARDERGGFILETVRPDAALDADILIAHTGIPDNWVVRTRAPIIWILHGRPAACFKPEQNTKGASQSYSLMADLAQWPRIKKMVTFWPEHVPYWDVIIPNEKLVCLDAPPIDARRYNPDVPTHLFSAANRGEWNLLIADTWRDDVDCFDVIHAAILAARRIKGLKIHTIAIETQADGQSVLSCWDHIYGEIREMGALGEIMPRIEQPQQWYRAADVLLTAHRISVRTMAEALCCGTPVVAGQPCRWTPYVGIPEDPNSMAEAVERVIHDLHEHKEATREATLATAKAFSLENYSAAMEPVYESIL